MPRKWFPVVNNTSAGASQFVKWSTQAPGYAIEGAWKGQHKGQYGPLGTIETAHGDVVFPIPTALREKVERIRTGAQAGIEYLGKRERKSGNEYHDFNVAVGHPDDLVEAPDTDDSDVPF
jgi:hypothetical protein